MMNLPQDFADLLAAFAECDVRYLVIGGYAVSFHDRPRTTKDLDILLDATAANRERVLRALTVFGAPDSVVSDLATAESDEIVWWGTPPLRIDLLQSAPGVDFDLAYTRRVQTELGGILTNVISLDDLIAAKRAAGRDQDIVDAKRLEMKRAP
jgi:hypothetical protein